MAIVNTDGCLQETESKLAELLWVGMPGVEERNDWTGQADWERLCV